MMKIKTYFCRQEVGPRITVSVRLSSPLSLGIRHRRSIIVVASRRHYCHHIRV
jgi:hypothetical protein